MTATLKDLSVDDIKKLIRDSVGAELATQMVNATDKAKEVADRAVADGKVGELLAAAGKSGGAERASVDLDSLQVLHDPLKGKGLNVARAIKAGAAAKIDNRSPLDMAHSWVKAGHKQYSVIADAFDAQQRAFTSGNFASGGSLVPPEMSSEIVELLYAATVALAMGARTIEFRGSISLGKISAGATVAYAGEALNIVPSQPSTAELRLTGRKASAVVVLSNELIRNPAVGADAIVRDDLVAALAVRRDLSFFRGTGDTFQPKGLNKAINASNQFASVGTTTGNKVADLVKAIRLVDESNVLARYGAMPGFVMSPRSKWSIFSALDANSNLTFAAMLAAGNIFGAPVRTTTSIPNNLGGGSDSEVYCVMFQDCIIGFDQATPMAVEAFPNGTFYDGSALQSGISSDQTPIRLLEGHDILVRHDTAGSLITTVQWT